MWELSTLEVSLPAAALAEPRAAALRHLRRGLGRYHARLDGVPLDLRNVRIVNGTSAIEHDRADLRVEVSAEFRVFRPKVGDRLRGVVLKKCRTHLSALSHGAFNAVVARPKDLEALDWIGDRAEVGRTLSYVVTEVRLSENPPHVAGALDSSSLIEDGDSAEIMPERVGAVVEFEQTRPEATLYPRKRKISKEAEENRKPVAEPQDSDSSDSDDSQKQINLHTLKSDIIKRILKKRSRP